MDTYPRVALSDTVERQLAMNEGAPGDASRSLLSFLTRDDFDRWDSLEPERTYWNPVEPELTATRAHGSDGQ